MEALLNNPGVVGAIIIFILMAGYSLVNFSERECSCKEYEDEYLEMNTAASKTQQQEHSNTTNKKTTKVQAC